MGTGGTADGVNERESEMNERGSVRERGNAMDEI